MMSINMHAYVTAINIATYFYCLYGHAHAACMDPVKMLAIYDRKKTSEETMKHQCET